MQENKKRRVESVPVVGQGLVEVNVPQTQAAIRSQGITAQIQAAVASQDIVEDNVSQNQTAIRSEGQSALVVNAINQTQAETTNSQSITNDTHFLANTNERNQTVEGIESSLNQTRCTSTIRNPGLTRFAPLDIPNPEPAPTTKKRPWKHIYAERLVVERNWRTPKYMTCHMLGHTSTINSMHHDPSTHLLITASSDCTLRAWNADTGATLGIMHGHTQAVTDVQFDTGKIISCSMDRTLRIWHRGTFGCVRVVTGHTASVLTLHFDDKMLASGASDGSIRVWNLQKGCSFVLLGHEGPVNKVRLLPCLTRILSGGQDATMRLWDISTQSILRTFSGHKAPVFSLVPLRHNSYTPGPHRRIATASGDQTIKIWDFETGKCLSTLFGHTSAVMALGADSLRLVSASRDCSVKVWDLETGIEMFGCEHQCAVKSVLISDTVLISGDERGIVTVRDFLNT